MGGNRKVRAGALIAACGVPGLTAGAAFLPMRLDRSRVGERLASDAQAAGLRAADGVRNLVGSLENQVQNGIANPRLVATLDANVDQETLRDLLLTEPWWEPFRRAVDGFGLYRDETTAVVTSHLPGSLDAHALVHDARQAHHPSSGLVEGTAVSALTVIGRYTLVDRIGQGGMAEIYSAVTTGERSFRRPVVIKRLRPELALDPQAVAQFCDEANLLSAFHHPNIVAVHDFVRWQNQFFLAEEYVAGRDLGRLIGRHFTRAQRPPPTEFTAYVASEALKALDYAHTLQYDEGRPLGIVHRDVSPENVMVSGRGDVKLLDFGVGKAAEDRVAKTEVGVVKGNVTYMAPEQARGLEVDSRADLYSLGLVLFGCCTGGPLYTGETTYGLLMKAASGPGPEERAAIDQLPRPFGAVVQRATAPRLEDRYRTAREMAADLEPWARHGAAVSGALVTELYGPELKDEAHRLATFVVDGPPGVTATLASR
jgi:Protein kinase domain